MKYYMLKKDSKEFYSFKHNYIYHDKDIVFKVLLDVYPDDWQEVDKNGLPIINFKFGK